MPDHWLVFVAVVGILLLVDLLFLQRRGRPVSVRMAWLWTVLLGVLAAAYAVFLGFDSGKQPALEFMSGYLIEGSLSVDNLFVFLLLFRSLRLDVEQQRHVLLWGVLGAIVLRGLLIVAGTALLARFEWVQYIFGLVLAIAAIRLLMARPGVAPSHGPVHWIQQCCMERLHDGRLALRTLLLIIAAVEATDLIFAVDSIPAVLAVTRNPWIAFTSNIFAVLGLRSLYFALASMLDSFHLLHYGLACILGFVAFKMLAAHWITIPAVVSLLVIIGILVLFALLSKLQPPASGAERPS